MAEDSHISCPICLVSSNDEHHEHEHGETEQNVVFVKTPCGHIFCLHCIERVLIKPRVGRIPTRGPCPMCRETVTLFDLCHAVEAESEDASQNTTSVDGIDSDASTWPSE